MRTKINIMIALLLALAMLLGLASTALAVDSDDADSSAVVTQTETDELSQPPAADSSAVVTQTETATPTAPPAAAPVNEPPLPPEAITATATCAPSEKVSPAKSSPYRLYVGGRLIPVNPFYQGSTLMMPLRVLAEKTGYVYEYRKGTVTMYGGGKTLKINIGKNKYPVGGKTRSYEFAPVLVDNYTYVPWLFLKEGLGMRVTVAADGRVDVKLPTLSKVLYINGKRMSGSAPFYSGKTMMIPLRLVAERLGCTYYYSNKERFSAFTKDGVETRVYWGKKTATQGDVTIKIDKSTTLKNNALFVPKSFIERMFNAKVTVEKNGRVSIKTK